VKVDQGVTVDSETLSVHHLKKKVWLASSKLHSLPWSGIATEMRVNIGHAHLCTLQYSVYMVTLGHCISM
jgi:hypothetical protein